MQGFGCALRLYSLREGVGAGPMAGSRRLRDSVLAALKAAALAGVGAALLAWRAWTPVARTAVDGEAGIALRYPRGWCAGARTGLVVQACELPCDVARPSIDAPRKGCCVAFWRLAWSDFESLGTIAPAQRPADQGREDHARVAAAVAAYVGLRSRLEVVGSALLAGRPATMIRGRGAGGPVALAVAPGPDLAFLLFQAPNERALQASWPLWTAMVRAARLIGPEAVAPVLLRPGSLIPLDGDW